MSVQDYLNRGDDVDDGDGDDGTLPIYKRLLAGYFRSKDWWWVRNVESRLEALRKDESADEYLSKVTVISVGIGVLVSILIGIIVLLGGPLPVDEVVTSIIDGVITAAQQGASNNPVSGYPIDEVVEFLIGGIGLLAMLRLASVTERIANGISDSPDSLGVRAGVGALVFGVGGVIVAGLPEQFTLRFIVLTYQQGELFFQFIGLLAVGTSVVAPIIFGIFIAIQMNNVRDRGRKIDEDFQFHVSYLYGLAQGGRDPLGIIEEAAASDDVYKYSAEEFQVLDRKINALNQDLNTALDEVAASTASDQFADTLTDLRDNLTSGGDVEEFLKARTDDRLEQAMRSAQQNNQVIELMAEVYVNAIILPLMLYVLYMVQALQSSIDIGTLYAVTGGVFVGSILFAIMVYVLAQQSSTSGVRIRRESRSLDRSATAAHQSISSRSAPSIDEEKEKAVERRVASLETRIEWEDFLSNPLETFVQKPVYSLGITLPLMLLWFALTVGTGLVDPFSYTQAPFYIVTMLLTVPLVIGILPFDLVRFVASRRRSKVEGLLPEFIREVRQQNDRGQTFQSAVRYYALNNDDVLANRLEEGVRGSATSTLDDELIDMANELEVPRLSRTLKLLVTANDATANLSQVLQVAEEDLRQAQKIDKERQQGTALYLVIILLMAVMFSGILLAMKILFLDRVEALSEDLSGRAASRFKSIPFDEFTFLFFAGSYGNAFGSGIVANTLYNRNIIGGVKVGIILAVLTTGLWVGAIAFF